MARNIARQRSKRGRSCWPRSRPVGGGPAFAPHPALLTVPGYICHFLSTVRLTGISYEVLALEAGILPCVGFNVPAVNR